MSIIIGEEEKALEDILWRVYLPKDIVEKLGIEFIEEKKGIKDGYIYHFKVKDSQIFNVCGYKLFYMENMKK